MVEIITIYLLLPELWPNRGTGRAVWGAIGHSAIYKGLSLFYLERGVYILKYHI